METVNNKTDETRPQPPIEETKTPEEKTLPPEEPISLKKIFPEAKQDLDLLFPEPGMKKLLKDIVRTRKKNDRFLRGIDTGQVPIEAGDGGE